MDGLIPWSASNGNGIGRDMRVSAFTDNDLIKFIMIIIVMSL